MERQPWANDLSEILQHGLDLVHHDTGAKRRLALVVVDNFVELLIKTYLSLPSRLTGVKLGRKRFEEVSERFPSLLDALEEHAGNKLDGVSLAEIEWYHQLRNQLYHNGVGLTVERNQVETYAELARLLFHHLLG